MSLYIVSKLTSKDLVVQTENQMELNWTINTYEPISSQQTLVNIF